jgi:ribosomal-protein-alanine N-acetyltransferase
VSFGKRIAAAYERHRRRYKAAMQLARLVELAPSLAVDTPRLQLRRFATADVAFAVAQEGDRTIMRWIRDPQGDAEVRERAAAMAAPWQGRDGEWLAMTVRARDGSAPFGLLVARATTAATQTMEIGYRFDANVHRRGYAHEACTALVTFLFGGIGVRKLVALCAADNEPSWRLMAKLGMQREACLREYSWLDGAWRDEFVYGLLAREWPAPPAEGTR